jgi:hypothetical protein
MFLVLILQRTRQEDVMVGIFSHQAVLGTKQKFDTNLRLLFCWRTALPLVLWIRIPE